MPLSVSFVEDAEIEDFYLRHGEAGPTDASKLPQDDPMRTVCGCSATRRSARGRGRGKEPGGSGGELRLLLVHGILHLLGDDHEEDGEPAEDVGPPGSATAGRDAMTNVRRAVVAIVVPSIVAVGFFAASETVIIRTEPGAGVRLRQGLRLASVLDRRGPAPDLNVVLVLTPPFTTAIDDRDLVAGGIDDVGGNRGDDRDDAVRRSCRGR